MTDSTVSNDTSYHSEDVEYEIEVRRFEGSPESSTAKGVEPKFLRGAVKYCHSMGSPRTEVRVQVDTEIILRQMKADELRRRLDDRE
jgi:hypothetical protein